MSDKKKAIAIDGNSLIYRCFYATYNQLQYYKDHNLQPVNALNLFIYSVLKLINEKKYDYALIAFDHGKKTFRTEKFEQYKEGRKPMPDELISQLSEIRSSVEMMGILGMSKENYEADDLIGSFAKIMNNNDVKLDIYSSDRDMLQLVNSNTTIKLFKTGVSAFDEYNMENFSEKFFGLIPEQITDYKGIAGDNSDFLKGIPSIGPKTTVNLLLKYRNLENIYSHISELPLSQQKKLCEYKKNAFECKELATILSNLLDNEDINKFKLCPCDFDKLLSLLNKYHLNKLIGYITKIKSIEDKEK